MATCKDCLHLDVCYVVENYGEDIDEEGVEYGCNKFQDRTKYVNAVRCKDCKHYQHYGKTSLLVDGKNIKAGWCQRRIRHDEEHRTLSDDFCSYGERRD